MNKLIVLSSILICSVLYGGDPSDCLSMRLDPSILLNGKYRDPNWRPDPVLKVGDHVPHEINGKQFEFVVIGVFWEGRVWRYITVPDHRILL